MADGASFTRTFETAGEREVTLTVTYGDGRTGTATETVVVGTTDNDPPSAEVTHEPDAPSVGEVVTFDPQASDPDGTVETYEWMVDDEVVDTGPTFTYAFDATGEHRVTLRVVDDDGATATAAVTVNVAENATTDADESALAGNIERRIGLGSNATLVVVLVPLVLVLVLVAYLYVRVRTVRMGPREPVGGDEGEEGSGPGPDGADGGNDD